MEYRAQQLMNAANIAAHCDPGTLNPNYESATTFALQGLEGCADYAAYATAILLAAGEGQRPAIKTNILYVTREYSREQQVKLLRQAAGIAAHDAFSWCR